MMTQTIKEQILAIRDTGETNMFDVPHRGLKMMMKCN